MSNPNQVRIEQAFLRATTLCLGLVALVATLTTWATCYSALHRQMGRLIEEKARLVTAALKPDGEHNLTPAISRLLRDFPEVRAVGKLGPRFKGQVPYLEALYPNTSENDRAARRILREDAPVTSTNTRVANGSGYLWGAITSLPPASSNDTREVIILFAVESIFVAALGQSVFSGVVMLVMVLLASKGLARWFHREVGRPLQTLAPRGCSGDSLCERLPSFDTRQWPEFEQIAETLRNFRRDAIESNNKRRTAQRLADDRIREHRQGIDRKLRRAEDQATTDALTGLRNRAFLEEEFDPLVLDCINRREDMCIIMIDVDNFKAHNDTYGHAAGDAILRFMGGLLSAALRPTDCAVRYGGDEFMLLLPRTSAREALQVAQRIVTLFRQNAQSIDGGGLVSLSAGVASLANANTTEPAELMARADAALYHAKAEGKNAAILDTRRIRSEPACVHRQSPSP